MKLRFLGGTGTVTGSKYLLETESTRILVDCGLFQGYKQLRLRNWAPFPVDPGSIDAVLLTHAHLDHSGYIPLLVRNGFSGSVISTEATRDLCKILLPDSGYLQEKDAEYANRKGFSKHEPALPLYTREDAEVSLDRFRPVSFRTKVSVHGGIDAEFLPAGHILGASIIKLAWAGGSIVFSGDLGRQQSPTMVTPARVRHSDFLVVESTYGDRLHGKSDPAKQLSTIIKKTAGRGGSVLIPSFAVGRAQTLLYYIEELKRRGEFPQIPVFLDSPMAINASEIFCRHEKEHKLSTEQCRNICNVAEYVREAEDSKALDRSDVPKIIISASGMATGGRVLHHLKVYAPDSRNTILFAGFQAGGTRGDAITRGAQSVKIHGGYVPIRAEVHNLQELSAHGDADEILEWLAGFEREPKHTFVTHGEPAASDALRHRIEEELKWSCRVPEHGEEVAFE